jgi:hypothetical protein
VRPPARRGVRAAEPRGSRCQRPRPSGPPQRPCPFTATGTYGYDDADHRTNTTFPGGATQTNGYDNAGRQTLLKVTNPTPLAKKLLRRKCSVAYMMA